MQDWSQCTVACGGGKQFLQRVCIPPQPGGKDCEGLAILERECNNVPCPTFTKNTSEITNTNKPIVKFQRLSNRTLRYEVIWLKYNL